MFKKKLIQTLKNTINNLEDENFDLKFKISQINIVIKDCQKENEILLNNSMKQKEKIKDLENNIEFLTNNSKNKKIKELVQNLATEN